MGLDDVDNSFFHQNRIVFDRQTCTPKLVKMYAEEENRGAKKPGKTFCSPVRGSTL